MAKRLTQDMVGSIAYTLKVDGQLFETVSRDEAIEYLHGADNLVPGLEAALEGRQAGERFQIALQPADAYGDYDETLVENIPAGDFDNIDELEVGMELEVIDEDGDEFEATVKEITPQFVTLDFNPELAGRVLEYDVEVVAVREASGDEVALGFPTSLLDEIFEDEEDGHSHPQA